MTEPTREEKCRCIAEWCGWKFIVGADESQWHHPACSCVAMKPEDPGACHDGCYWQDGEDAPNFYLSEEASALALEHCGGECQDEDHYFAVEYREGRWFAGKKRDYHDGNSDMPVSPFWCLNKDRKTAIAEAAYLVAMTMPKP